MLRETKRFTVVLVLAGRKNRVPAGDKFVVKNLNMYLPASLGLGQLTNTIKYFSASVYRGKILQVQILF